MACSSRLRVQGNPFLHKNPSNESKPWIFGKKYSVLNFLIMGMRGIARMVFYTTHDVLPTKLSYQSLSGLLPLAEDQKIAMFSLR
jgi:hypothetical protein